MEKNEEKREEQEVKQDSLMWSENDYETVQKITGFDDESVLEDQKKGVSIVILVVVCIVSLIVGMLLGYNFNKKDEPQPTVYTDEPKVVVPAVVAAYTKMNESNELYLYIKNSLDEEFSIMQLNDYKYFYELANDNLYILVDKDGLTLYEYSFTKTGYHREIVSNLTDRYESFNYKNDLILIKRENYVRLYTKSGVIFKEVEYNIDTVVDYDSNYIIYQNNSGLYLYDLNKDESKTITEKESKYLLRDNNKIFYFSEGKINFYDIESENIAEIVEVESSSFLIKLDNYYLYNDAATLYMFDEKASKIKEFSADITEYAYLDQDNIILILSDYDNIDCALKQIEYGVFNISTKSLTMRKITGCLNSIVINDLKTIK